MKTRISYMDDTHVLNQEFREPEKEVIYHGIMDAKMDMNYVFEEDGELWGYRIHENTSLRKIYNFPVYVVRFYFTSISRLHDEHQEKILDQLMEKCHAEMKLFPGYYVVRIPAHIVDCIRAFNKYANESIFCGGIVELVTRKQANGFLNNNNIHVFFAEQEYLDLHGERLKEISRKSFEVFQGHFHVSSVTEENAGEIYENWIKNSLSCDDNNRILIAEKDQVPIGFFSIAEDDYTVEAVLTAVDNSYRNLGAYRSMVGTLINYAFIKEKCMCAGTQIDNFISQGTWTSLGMVPYYTFYNMHFDYRK